jgi:U3 small nucleolar RNA-associated protein 21
LPAPGSKKQHLLSSSESLKLPPITALSSSTARSKDWADILSAHQPSVNSAIGTKGAQNHLARTWSGRDCKVGRFSLAAPGGKADVASAVCVTACGNFGLVGGAMGKVSMWNLQSGLERKSFALPSEAKVVGLATDSLNRVLVAAGADGLVEFFDFHSTQHLHSLGLPPTPESPSGGTVSAIALQRDSNLLAVSCANPHRVLLVDIETRRVVRDLRGFPSRILDLAFSPDSRWVIVASVDSVVRTFDVPSGSLVDAFRTESIPTSLAFSPTGDFLATAHADSVGVYLWANKAQFSEVALRAIEEGEVGEIAMPTVQGLEDDDGEFAAAARMPSEQAADLCPYAVAELEGVEDVGAPEQKDLYLTPDQLSGELLTLSLLPRSKWQTLLNLEVIKARNKPKEAPKAPKQAPFFLPSLQNDNQPQARVSLADQLGAGDEGQDGSAGKKDSHRFMDSTFSLETEFTRRLTSENVDGDCECRCRQVWLVFWR